MNKLASLVLSLVVLTSMSCKKEDAKGGTKTDVKADAKPAGSGGSNLVGAEDYVLKRAKANLADVKEKLAKGEKLMSSDCAAVLGFTTQLEAKKANPEIAAVVADADKTCGYDAPMATLETETKKAEAGRAKDPKGLVSDCFNAYASMAMEELKKKHGADPKYQALQKRWQTACPDKK